MKLILSSLAQKKEGKAELALIFRTLRKHLLYVFGFSCWVNLLMLTGPIFMLQVYERVLPSRSEQTLLVLFSLVVALYAIMGSLDYIRGQVMARVGALFQDRLSDRAFNAALAGAVSPEGKRAPATALRDLDSIQAALAGPGCLAILDLPWLPIYLIIIYLFHPWLGILATAAAILLIIVALLGELTTKKKQQAALQGLRPNQQAFPSTELEHSSLVRGDLDELALMPILGSEIPQQRLKGFGRMAELVAIRRDNVQPGSSYSSPAQIGQSREGGDQLRRENNNALRHRSAALTNNTPTFNWLRK